MSPSYTRRTVRWRLLMRAVVSLGLLLTVLGCQRAPGPASNSTKAFTDHLDTRVPALMSRYQVPGTALALIRDGGVVWTGAYGYADRGNRQPMGPDAIFRAESISKPVTAWGVIRLAENGAIDLDVPVERYLQGFELDVSGFDARKITVRRLLSHSAGLTLGSIGESAEYTPGASMPLLRDYLSHEAHITRAPGTAFEYSNVGFNMSELIVENVTGRNFADYMARDVLRPLGMNRSGFSWSKQIGESMPLGYDLHGAPVPAYVYPASASGGLLATAEDIGRFVAASVTRGRAGLAADTTHHAVLPPESIQLLHQPEIEIGGLFGVVADGYGLGHFVETLPGGQSAVWHGGQGHGWMTHFHAVPESGDGIVVLTNSERSWPMMARVLTDWAQWRGLGSVKFGRITNAETVFWGLIALGTIAVLLQVIRLMRDATLGRRHWRPFSEAHRLVRGLQAIAGTGILAVIGWSAAQPYLFVSSIFPVAAVWAGRVLATLAIALMVSALFPRTET